MNQTSNNLVLDFWAIGDLLRGDFKQSQYGRIILPFCLLRRLECVLESTKSNVLVQVEKLQDLKLPEDEQEELVLRATGGLSFFNTSKMDLGKLGEAGIKANLESYIQSFSKNAHEIFEYFNFAEFINQLNDANLLNKVVQKIRTIDLSLNAVSNHQMGLVFDELIRLFVERSNETVGEHFTPRDIVRLATALVFMGDDALIKPEITRTIYDPTAGTGGFLSSSISRIYELNSQVEIHALGQEVNTESAAMCKAAMLISGQDARDIRVGNTLTNDVFVNEKFDYVFSNPPMGMNWKRFEPEIVNEHIVKGYEGRFGPGLPRTSDSSFLFILHAINKLKPRGEGGGKAAVIVNNSCLTVGGAGTGESEIRRWIIEQDLLQAVVILPDGMLLNTSVPIYLLIFNNLKTQEQKNKVHVIDARNLHLSMRSRIGSKSSFVDQEAVNQILYCYASRSESDISKIVDNRIFGYREYKINLPSNRSEFEKIPLGQQCETYIEQSLNGVYGGYKIDDGYCDPHDKNIGRLGYEFAVRRLFVEEDESDKQFRFYFEETKDNWLFSLAKASKKVIFTDEAVNHDESKNYFFKPKISFNENYLRHFFNSNAWRDWVMDRETSGAASLNRYSLARKKIFFPSEKNQKTMADLLDDINLWKKRLATLESDLWADSDKNAQQAQFELPMQQDVISRLIELMPYPLANILHHYRSVPQDAFKDRYELLLKMIESLAIFVASLVVGSMENDLGEYEATQFLLKQKKYLKNATFGTWHSLIKQGQEKYIKSPNGLESILLKEIFESEMLSLIEEAKDIRNGTLGHGSYPTKGGARSTFKKVEEVFNRLTVDLAGIFSNHVLIRPLKASWNGAIYKTECDEFSGLGANPFGIIHIETKVPLISNRLYVISKTNFEQYIQLFPFIRLIDIYDEYGIESFYFYSRMLDANIELSKGKFVYISHQQIAEQSQYCIEPRIEKFFQ